MQKHSLGWELGKIDQLPIVTMSNGVIYSGQQLYTEEDAKQCKPKAMTAAGHVRKR